MATNQLPRLSKRSRASDVAEKSSRPGQERAKRRRTSDTHNTPHSKTVISLRSSNYVEDTENTDDLPQNLDRSRSSASWSFSRPVGGRYSDLDPILTEDEAHLFVGLDTAVQLFATSTSRLLRTLQMQAGQRVIGFKICPCDPEILYIFTSALVTKWHWNSGKQLAQWETNSPAVAIDVRSAENRDQPLLFSIATKEDSKREILIDVLSDKKLASMSALETREQINMIQVAYGGRIIVASDGSRLFMGTASNIDLESSEATQYTWAEATLPVTATCFDIRETSTAQSQFSKNPRAVDLVIGESHGSLLIYRDIGNTLFGRSMAKEASLSKLHWHRNSVNTVRWSRDGNYLISGGQEPVLIMWQLDTGRTQPLPHLSSSICNVIVSPSGNSYVVKLSDNSILIFPASGSEVSASMIGLQLSGNLSLSKDVALKRPSGVIAALHPQHPERLLIAVPASHRPIDCHNSAILQTFDIRTDSHISRQALARTNTTTLTISPEGSSIVAPDIQHLDISRDGKWLATVDTWTPHPQDVGALIGNKSNGRSSALRPEILLKFWRWNASSNMWQLVTRIDGPHFAATCHSTVFGIAARPFADEFASFGADALVRFWCPTARQRNSLRNDKAEQHFDTWKCRNFVDLSGCLDDSVTSLTASCLSFSEDGSVLAICLPSSSSASYGIVVLIGAQNCAVRYCRSGVFFGSPRTAKFLGKYLVVSSANSVVVWDTVDDVVRPIHVRGSAGLSDHSKFIAVSPKTQSFAVADRGLDGCSSPSSKKPPQSYIRIYDVSSLDVIFKSPLEMSPLVLLSDVHTGGYIMIDAAATVQRLGCLDTVYEKGPQPNEVNDNVHLGLTSIFSHDQAKVAAQPIDSNDSVPQTDRLASVFGDTPSFSLPALGVLFRNVVQSFASE